ncbi:HAMP domain-containing protein [Pleurocapsales cyanobacterium LEGE 06147]|nr:HAMP domain-containing protein [Pleurocapsales cyanobacterium LEGE 06147]
MAVSTPISILAIRQTFLNRLYSRIEQSLVQEVQEFQQLVDGRNPETSEPFGDDLKAIFTVFLQRNIPDDSEFLLTMLDGYFYKSSPRAVPEVLEPTGKLVQSLAYLSQPEQRWLVTPNGETIVYRAEPIVRGNKQGVFAVVYIVSQERQEIDEATLAIVQVTLGVLVFASVLAWIAAGRAMTPLSLLTEAVRTIGDSDLTRRLPVQGTDEISELTLRFNEMLDRLQITFDSQRDFISDAGHELRTPITIIRGHLELMGDDPQERQEILAIVTDELNRMSRFVDDLLLLARAEQQDFLRLDIVDVASLTDELFAKVKTLAERNWHLEAKGKGRIVADRQRLTQAIMNLAQNATQHTKADEAIALGSALERGNARFWVRDTGEGIAWEDQQRIFERFARTANSYRRSEGAGLGLAIVRAIAQAHGGRVELISRLGEGATFTLIIPIDPI